MENAKAIATYYDYTRDFYKVFWHGETRALHYGIWNIDTPDLHTALLNTNQVLAERAQIRPGDNILDAGCGVGGSAFWLAKTLQVSVTGITISDKQLEKARDLAKRYNLSERVRFFKESYLHTSFANGCFDVIWALESFCYAEDKPEFLKEAYRLLKPGGRLIIGDGFLEREPKTLNESQCLKSFLTGWVLPPLISSGQLQVAARECGFRDTQTTNETGRILPTARIMRRMSLWSAPLSRVTTWLRITPDLLYLNNKAGIAQYDLFNAGVLGWYIFSAKK